MAQRAAPSSATTASWLRTTTDCTPAALLVLATKIVQRSSPNCHPTRSQLSPVAPLERVAGATCDPLANSSERHRQPNAEVTQRRKNSQSQVRLMCSFARTTRDTVVRRRRSISATANEHQYSYSLPHRWLTSPPESMTLGVAHSQRPLQRSLDAWMTVVKPRLCHTFREHAFTRQDLRRKLAQSQTQCRLGHC